MAQVYLHNVDGSFINLGEPQEFSFEIKHSDLVKVEVELLNEWLAERAFLGYPTITASFTFDEILESETIE